MEISSKTNTNVDQLFFRITSEIIQTIKNNSTVDLQNHQNVTQTTQNNNNYDNNNNKKCF